LLIEVFDPSYFSYVRMIFWTYLLLEDFSRLLPNLNLLPYD